MKHNIPSSKPRYKAKRTTGFLQRNRRRLMTVRRGKVTGCDSKKAQIHKEKDQYIRKVAGERPDQECKDEDCPQDHEESHGVVVLRCIIAECLCNSEGWG